jgi:hypothetical protein
MGLAVKPDKAIMFFLERLHLARSWNGWMMTSDYIMDDLL